MLWSEGNAVMKHERALLGSELNWVTRVRRDSVLYITAFCTFSPTGWNLSLKLKHIFFSKGEEHCSFSSHPVIPSLLCI